MRAAALLLALSACSVERADERVAWSLSAIQGGAIDDGDPFAVGVFLDAEGVTCSGTLIAPNLVLTARHCVSSDDTSDGLVDCSSSRFVQPVEPTAIRIGGDAAAVGSDAIGVTRVVVPSDTAFCGNDVALLVLDTALPADAITPATPVFDRAAAGSSIDAIGFGATSASAEDQGHRRRLDDVPITCLGGGASPCDDASTVAPSELLAGAGLCDGDSGSGAFVPASLDSPTPQIVGSLSRGTSNGDTCADALYELFAPHQALFVATAKGAATEGGYALPGWASGGASTGGASGSGALPPYRDGDHPTAPPPQPVDQGCRAAGAGASSRDALAIALAIVVTRRARRTSASRGAARLGAASARRPS